MSEELKRPEPGDMAMIVKSFWRPEFIGREVYCDGWTPTGTEVLRGDGRVLAVGYREFMDISGLGRFSCGPVCCLIKLSPDADQFADEREDEDPDLLRFRIAGPYRTSHDDYTPWGRDA